MKRLLAALAMLAITGCVASANRPEGPPPEVLASLKFDPHAALVEALHSGQPPLQAIAAETYLDADRPPPRQDIEGLADTHDPRVRMIAVAVIGAGRRPDMAPLLGRKLRDDDPNVRLAAAFGLAMAGDGSQVVALRDALASLDLAQRRTAVWLLGLMGNPSAAGMIKVKLDDPDAIVVLRAAEALWRLGSRDGVDQVRALTEYDLHQVRYVAVRLLGRIGDTTDIPRLEKLCQSRFLDVKFAAIAAVAQLGDFKRIGLLLDMLDAPDPEMRVLAARELGETAYTPAMTRLEKLLASPDLAERTAAAAAIVRIVSARTSWRSRILADRPPPPTPDAAPPAPPKTPSKAAPPMPPRAPQRP